MGYTLFGSSSDPNSFEFHPVMNNIYQNTGGVAESKKKSELKIIRPPPGFEKN